MLLRTSSRWFVPALVAVVLLGPAGKAIGAEPFVSSVDIEYSDASSMPYENRLDVYLPKDPGARPAPVQVSVTGVGGQPGDKRVLEAA